MGLTEIQILELKKPLSPSKVKSRKQGEILVDYVQSWQVIDEMNRIFDFQWSRETVYCREVARYSAEIGKYKKDGWKVCYEAKVRVEVAGMAKEGTGHGTGSMQDLCDCIESAAKEAESDAMKRALMQLGYTFGLALYDKTKENVKEVSKPVLQPLHERLKIKVNSIKTITELEEWKNNQAVKDACDKLYTDNKEFSTIVEDAIKSKLEELQK